MASDWTAVLYDDSYRSRVVDLMSLVQAQPASREDFIWEFERNPVGELNIFLAVRDDEVIGMSCHNAFRLRVGEESFKCSFPLNVLTHPSHRGRGIFSTLESLNEERARDLGYPFMLSFPNALSTKIFLQRLGWSRLRPPLLLGRPPLRRDVERKGLRLSPANAFDASVDGWRQPGPPQQVGFDRDHIYLNWRFVERPGRNYQVSIVEVDGVTIGYVVTGLVRKRGTAVRFIAALNLLPDRGHLYATARAAALADPQLAAAAVELDLAGFGRALWREAASGFVPLPKKLNAIYKPLGSDGNLIVRDPKWAIHLGDLDFF